MQTPTIVKITKITKLPAIPLVYDVTVEHTHNLFVCSETSQKSILAHNCSRDNPTNVVVVGEDVDEEFHRKQLAKLKRYDRHFHEVINLSEWSQMETLIKEKPCKDLKYYNRHMANQYDECPLAKSKLCWSNQLEPTLVKLFDEKKPQPIDISRLRKLQLGEDLDVD